MEVVSLQMADLSSDSLDYMTLIRQLLHVILGNMRSLLQQASLQDVLSFEGKHDNQ